MQKIVVKREDALKRVFKGVSLDSLAVGEKSMVTKMNYVKGNYATTHQHPHEQCGYVISGQYRLIVETEPRIDVILTFGDSYAIPGNTPHSFEVLAVYKHFLTHNDGYRFPIPAISALCLFFQ